MANVTCKALNMLEPIYILGVWMLCIFTWVGELKTKWELIAIKVFEYK